jgi:outer membrane immunogenic protein
MVRVFSWTGCYIGGNIGYGWGPFPALRDREYQGGGQVGCNYQFAPNWVIGIEGDGEAANIKGDVTDCVSFTNPFSATVSGTAHAQTDWIASVTGRLSWTSDRVMLYAKGGAAWAGDRYSADLPAFDEHIETSVKRPGWTVGGGVEWAFWDNWSAKVEYDCYYFSTRNLTLPGTILGVADVVPGVNIKETIQTVKFGSNYRFGAY